MGLCLQSRGQRILFFLIRRTSSSRIERSQGIVNPFHNTGGRNNGSLRCPGPHISKARRLLANYSWYRLIVQWLLSTWRHPKLLCRSVTSQGGKRESRVTHKNNKQINAFNAPVVMPWLSVETFRTGGGEEHGLLESEASQADHNDHDCLSYTCGF